MVPPFAAILRNIEFLSTAKRRRTDCERHWRSEPRRLRQPISRQALEHLNLIGHLQQTNRSRAGDHVTSANQNRRALRGGATAHGTRRIVTACRVRLDSEWEHCHPPREL